MKKRCSAEGCDRTAVAKGLCTGHYHRVRKNTKATGPLRERSSRVGKICKERRCTRPVTARGWCNVHYKKYHISKTCSVEGCDRPYSAKGLCKDHYDRVRKGIKTTKPLRERVLPVEEEVSQEMKEWQSYINRLFPE